MAEILDKLLETYDYDTDPVLKEFLHARDKKACRGQPPAWSAAHEFWRQSLEHQARVAKDAANFARRRGYSPQAARNIEAALVLHDWGKADARYAEHADIWWLENRPTEPQRALKKLHARFGAEMIDRLTGEVPELRGHPHMILRRALTLYHHERLDGSGPEKIRLGDLPDIIQIGCIADTYDGDMMLRPHQERSPTPAEEFERLAGGLDQKYASKFSPDFVADYVAMKTAELAAAKIPLTRPFSPDILIQWNRSPH